MAAISRQRITVTGVVQGVGFRPFVYGLAQRMNVSGFVGNDSHGVFIEVEGAIHALEAFCNALVAEAPPLAYIDEVTTVPIPAQAGTEFFIVQSQAQPLHGTLISPDLTLCDDCLLELFDPANRRYRYPFINCTNCGPRFTITKDIPYDRPLTTMAPFPMCSACQAEYENPLDRRFHAQPNACPRCGPQLTFQWSTAAAAADGTEEAVQDAALLAALALLRGGGIVAIKGIGGFHLACAATDEQAVQQMRQRKGRIDKPFAVMAADLETVRRFAHVSADEAALLTSRARPIVLLRKKEPSSIAASVAPGNHCIGVMLPYSPLHHLLFATPDRQSGAAHQPSVLVMTSGNYASEPIVRHNDEAVRQLAPLVDAFLLHNRDIYVPCDDSVMRVFGGQELPIRRSRGYAPFPVKLPFAVEPTLAVGGELKSTFCLAHERFAFMSQHMGDMENLETLAAFEQAVAHFEALFRISPQQLVCDMHPRYLSTQWAQRWLAQERWPGARLLQVQHHHAHVASMMAENELDGAMPVLGVCFDGTGYGPDGTIWGGEVLLADYGGYQRLAHLKPLPLPGGDAAVKRPYRLALAWLWACGIPWDEELPPVAACPPSERSVLQRQLERSFNCVQTSSMGRLFDVVAALVGVRQTITYEAQAAVELEALAAAAEEEDVGNLYSFGWDRASANLAHPMVLDPSPLLRAIVGDVLAGAAPGVVARRFHLAVAEMVAQLCVQLVQQSKQQIAAVALSGGVFQNVHLLEQTTARLHNAGLRTLTHRQVPANDGGLALGQAIIASARATLGTSFE